MAFLRISDVYACIHKTLREDKIIRDLMGFTDQTTLQEMALRIQKRMTPVDVIVNNLPMISFYKSPGRRGYNPLEYTTVFDFDIYTNNDVELAIDLADRISELFDEQYLNLSQGSHFKGEYVTSAEDVTDKQDVYKYFVRILFTFGIEGVN